MTKHLYEDFDPEKEIRLCDACYTFGDPEAVAQASKLENEGFDSNGVVIISGDWRDKMYGQHQAAMRVLQGKIKNMIEREELIAFGYDNDPLNGPKWLKPAIWRHADVSFPRSKLLAGGSKGLAITNIVVFLAPKSREDPVDRSTIAYSKAKLRRAYIAHIEMLQKAGETTNREEDVAAMKTIFGRKATHPAVIRLRKDYAPKVWKEPGRRKSREK